MEGTVRNLKFKWIFHLFHFKNQVYRSGLQFPPIILPNWVPVSY